jgi:hypothetical protein
MFAECYQDDRLAPTVAEIRAISTSNHESVCLKDLRRFVAGDHEYQQLKYYVENGTMASSPSRGDGLSPARKLVLVMGQ